SDAALDGKQLKALREVLDAEPFVPEDVVALARWTAEDYPGGAGAAITAVLPPKARGLRADGHKTIRLVSVTAAGLEAVNGGSDGLTGKQGGAVARLSRPPAAVS